MSAARDDRPDVAADYAEQMRDGLRRLRSVRLTGEQRSRMRTATRHAVIGVLKHSSDRDQLKIAGDVLRMLEVERHGERLRADSEALRAHGATITDRQIISTATQLGERSADRQLADLDDARLVDGLEGL